MDQWRIFQSLTHFWVFESISSAFHFPLRISNPLARFRTPGAYLVVQHSLAHFLSLTHSWITGAFQEPLARFRRAGAFLVVQNSLAHFLILDAFLGSWLDSWLISWELAHFSIFDAFLDTSHDSWWSTPFLTPFRFPELLVHPHRLPGPPNPGNWHLDIHLRLDNAQPSPETALPHRLHLLLSLNALPVHLLCKSSNHSVLPKGSLWNKHETDADMPSDYCIFADFSVSRHGAYSRPLYPVNSSISNGRYDVHPGYESGRITVVWVTVPLNSSAH